MEREHVHALDVAETSHKPGRGGDVVSIVGQAGHEDIAEPHRPVARTQASRKFQGRANVHACQFLVPLRIPRLDIEHHEIDQADALSVSRSPYIPVGVEGRVNAHAAGGGKELDGEAVLPERVSVQEMAPA